MADTKSIGIAYRDQALEGGTMSGYTLTGGTATGLTLTGGTKVGTSSTDTAGFYGAAATAQPASIAAAASTAVVSISATQWGFSTSTQGNALVTLANSTRAALVSLGLLAS